MLRFNVVAVGILAIILVAPRLVAADAAADQPLRRVAIIANDELQKSGVSDLLSDELQQAGFELVEREQLGKLVREQTLAGASNTDAAGLRIQLGKLVGADALILLEDEGAKDQRRVRIVIAECRQGARLLSERIRFGSSVPALAQTIRDHVIQTRARFPNGIKGIIAVTPFIAKNFTYEYHRLQQGYAVTLREALGGLNGIAVLDVEEAQSIRKELEIAGGGAAGVVPLFVEGEFEVTGGVENPRVRFGITLRNVAGTRAIAKENLTLEEASKYLSRDLLVEIMPAYSEAGDRAFTSTEEFKGLGARADQFARLGEYRHSADLRQAALAIRPNDVEQRNKLFYDCETFLQSLNSSSYFGRAGRQWEEATRGGEIYYETLLELVEWKIRASRSNPKPVPAWQADANLVARLNQGTAGKLAQPAKRDFLLHVYPLTAHSSWASTTDETELTHQYYWVEIMEEIAINCNGGPLGKEDFDLLETLLNEIVPPGNPPSPRLTGFFWGVDGAFMNGRSGPEFLPFLDRLKKSKNPINRLVAREALLTWKVTHRAKLTPDLLPEVDAIRSEYLALKLRKFGGLSPGVLEQLDWVGEQLKRPADADGRIPVTRLQEGIIGRSQMQAHLPGMRDLVFPDDPPPTFDAGALHFENLLLKRKFPGGTPIDRKSLQYPVPNRIARRAGEMDLLWDDQGGISAFREPCVADPLPILIRPQQQARDVKWDGKQTWIATAREGLWAMDAGGKIVAKVDESQGLPPCDKGALIVVLGPDSLLVIGSFSSSHRAFIAKIDKEAEHYRVNVFFKASQALGEHFPENPSSGIDFGFHPGEAARCATPSGGDYVVIRRQFSTGGAMTHPLIVDLKTLTVCVSKTAFQACPFLEVDGGFLQGSESDTGLTLWHLSPDGKGLATDFGMLRLPPERRNHVFGAKAPVWTVARDGMVYEQGYDWYRIDPKTMTACCLAKDGPPAGLRCSLAESNAGLVWWGIVGAKQYAMYRVVVDEEKVKQLPPSAFYHAERKAHD